MIRAERPDADPGERPAVLLLPRPRRLPAGGSTSPGSPSSGIAGWTIPTVVQPAWRRWIDRASWNAPWCRRAAGIVTVSGVWSGFYAGKYGLPTETVMNGFDPRDFSLDLDPPRGPAGPSCFMPARSIPAGAIRSPLFEAVKPPGPGVGASFACSSSATSSRRVRAARRTGWGVGDFRRDQARRIPYKDADRDAESAPTFSCSCSGTTKRTRAMFRRRSSNIWRATGRSSASVPSDGVPARPGALSANAGIFSNDPGRDRRRGSRAWIEEKRRDRPGGAARAERPRTVWKGTRSTGACSAFAATVTAARRR